MLVKMGRDRDEQCKIAGGDRELQSVRRRNKCEKEEETREHTGRQHHRDTQRKQTQGKLMWKKTD